MKGQYKNGGYFVNSASNAVVYGDGTTPGGSTVLLWQNSGQELVGIDYRIVPDTKPTTH